MADSAQSGDSSFAKVFIPGLVVGLIVGMAIGAIVPSLLEKAPAPVPHTGGPRVSSGERDGVPVQPAPAPAPTPAPTKPEDKPADPAAKPAEPAKPATP